MSVKIGAAYIRVSTDDQVEYSPDSQLKLIRDYAKHEGYLIPDEFVFQDEGISGKSADKRPAFRLMIAMAKDGNSASVPPNERRGSGIAAPPFNSIFVWKYSRFARNQEEAIMYKNLLKKRGVDVKSISEPSSDSPFASLIERIIEWMDEYYLINLAGEVRRGMKEKATRGEAMGKPPFGYRVENKTYIPDENAETVRWIFAQYAAGVGYRTIAKTLADRGIKTKDGRTPVAVWVQYILHNPAYIGKIRWSEDGRADYIHPQAQNENVMLTDGKHEALIDMDMWEKVQERLKARSAEAKYLRKNHAGIFMLKGIIRCGDCGSTLTLVYHRGRPSLQCCGYARSECRVSHSITLLKANEIVLAALEAAIQSKKYVFSPSAPSASVVMREWDKMIVSEEARLIRAKNALLDGVFSTSEYAAVKAEIEDNISRLTAGREEEAQSTKAPDLDKFHEKTREALAILKSPDVDDLTKNEKLRSIVDKILYIKPENRFDIYFCQ